MNKTKKGMSIVEVLVAIVIALCVGYAVYHLFSNASRLAAIAETKGSLRQEAQVILRALERDVASSRVVVDKKGLLKDGTERYKPDFKADSTSLTLYIPKTTEAPSNNSVLFDTVEADNIDDYDKVVYKWNNKGELSRGVTGKGSRVLGTHVSELKIESSLTYDGKIEAKIVMSAVPRGCQEPATHTENLIMSIRALQTKMLEDIGNYSDGRTNKYWRQKIRTDSQN